MCCRYWEKKADTLDIAELKDICARNRVEMGRSEIAAVEGDDIARFKLVKKVARVWEDDMQSVDLTWGKSNPHLKYRQFGQYFFQ